MDDGSASCNEADIDCGSESIALSREPCGLLDMSELFIDSVPIRAPLLRTNLLMTRAAESWGTRGVVDCVASHGSEALDIEVG